jgi:hypothetical protein
LIWFLFVRFFGFADWENKRWMWTLLYTPFLFLFEGVRCSHVTESACTLRHPTRKEEEMGKRR